MKPAHIFLQQELQTAPIETVWKRLLITHTRNSPVTDFSNDPLFAGLTGYSEDYLSGVSIGELSNLYEYSLSLVDTGSRKLSGQYFTPDDLARFLSEQSNLFPEGVWLDPCSGVGNLSYTVAALQDDPEQFVLNRLVLQDKDPLALLIARAFFTIRFQNRVPDLFSQLEARFVVKDYLTSTPIPHDYVIMNPPYLAVAGAQLNQYSDDFVTKQCGDLFALFMEQAVKTSKGFIAITPQTFLNTGKYGVLRDLFITSGHNYDFYVFDNMPDTIFRGLKYGSSNTNKKNSVRAAITVGTPTTNTPVFKSTAMLRWRAADRPELFNQAPGLLTRFEPRQGNLFPKLEKGTNVLWAKGETLPQLGTLFSKTPTEYKLTVPTTPRYYITATQRDLSRTSYRDLYFTSKEHYEYAYLLLNSSIIYWWWRTVDGGMTISYETLKTLPMFPLLHTENVAGLVEQLKHSEQNNLVVKKNAGKDNENVKHPAELVKQLTLLFLTPSEQEACTASHTNSHIIL